MSDNKKSKLISNYINNIVSNMKNNGVTVNKRAIDRFRSRFVTSTKDIDSIYRDIDETIEAFLIDYNTKIVYFDKLKSLKVKNNSSVVPFLGESYKSIMIDLFKIVENINCEYDLKSDRKEIVFNTEITRYLFKKKPEFEKLIRRQCSSEKRVQFYLKEMFLGIESLDYNIINNIYTTFTNSVDLVCPEIEGRMLYTVRNDKKIFNDDGSINDGIYDFSAMENIFRFASDHQKLLKLNALVWHGSVPENLKNEITALDSNKRRDYLLRFIDNYCYELCNWAMRNDFSFRQIEAINEMASIEEEKMLRDNFWSENIGVNPDNGDNYYIDILRIIRKHFNISEIIVSDYNEFDTSKCNRICGIVKDILDKGKRDKCKYIDGLGLASHYSTWFIKDARRYELTNSMIFQTMYEYKKLNLPLYRTEMDFKRFKNDVDNYSNLIMTRDKADKECNFNGYIIWGNCSLLSWYYCEGLNSTPVDSKGVETKEFKMLRDAVDVMLHKYKSSNTFNEVDYINNIIISSFRDVNNLDLKNKNGIDRINDIYSFYYDSFDKLINSKIRKKNALAIDKLKVYLKNCLTIGCSTREEFKNGMIIFNENSENKEIDKIIDAFKLTLIKNRVVKKDNVVLNNFLVGYCLVYVFCSILCIILGIKLL